MLEGTSNNLRENTLRIIDNIYSLIVTIKVGLIFLMYTFTHAGFETVNPYN